MKNDLFDWHMVAELCDRKRGWALAFIHQHQPVYIGRTPYITREHFYELKARNELTVDWSLEK